MPFQSSSAYELVKSLSFPRLVNTDGNRKAAERIASEFRSNKFEIEAEDFTFSTFPLEIATRLILGFYAFLSVLSLFLFTVSELASAALSAATLVLIAITAQWHKPFEKLYDIGKKKVAARNIIARKKSTSRADTDLVFMAHYDSKSQILPLGFRILLFGFTLLSFSGYVFALFVLIAHPEWSNLFNLCLLLNFCVLLSTAILEFNFTSNRSDGTLDNASGVGVILELAKIFGKLQFRYVNLTFIATDAEEMGMAGALKFIQKHQRNFDPKSSLFLNYDSIGSGKKFFIVSKRPILSYFQPRSKLSLAKLVLGAAKRSHIKTRMVHLIFGVGFDHIPLAVRGYEAVTLTSSKWRSIFKFHSKSDNIFQLEERALSQAGRVGYELALKLEFDARRKLKVRG